MKNYLLFYSKVINTWNCKTYMYLKSFWTVPLVRVLITNQSSLYGHFVQYNEGNTLKNMYPFCARNYDQCKSLAGIVRKRGSKKDRQ